jgi:hypothetical protein
VDQWHDLDEVRVTPEELVPLVYLPGRKGSLQVEMLAAPRSYGRLSRDSSGRLVLTYRPWLVFPARRLILPEGSYAVGRGLLYPEVVRVDGDSTDAILTLPPRYCGHEEEFNQIYQLVGVQNVGIKAFWDWVMGALRSKPAQSPAT